MEQLNRLIKDVKIWVILGRKWVRMPQLQDISDTICQMHRKVSGRQAAILHFTQS